METLIELPKVFSQTEETTQNTSFLMQDPTNNNLFPVQNDLSTLYSERKGIINEKPSMSKRQNTRRNQNLTKPSIQLSVVRVILSSR